MQTGLETNRIAAAIAATVLGLSAAEAPAQGTPGASRSAAPQGYPARAVRIVDAFPAGGGSDVVGRLIAAKLTDAWGQQVIVDNRPGAAGTIGAEQVARATPDGYTLIIITPSYAVSPSFYKLPYHPVNDVVPVAQTATGPFVVVVHPSVPVKTVTAMVALARAKPAALNYASTGTGGITHLATELFVLTADVKLSHIPYKGSAPAVADLIGGQIHLMFSATATAMPFVTSGKLRALAVTGPKRMAALPELPTVRESGVPGYEVTLWYGIWGPKGLPDNLVAYWNSEVNRVIQLPDIRERFASSGLEPAVGTPADFGMLLKSEVERWATVVKRAGIKID